MPFNRACVRLSFACLLVGASSAARAEVADRFDDRPVIASGTVTVDENTVRRVRIVQVDPRDYPMVRIEETETRDPRTGRISTVRRAVVGNQVVVRLPSERDAAVLTQRTGFTILDRDTHGFALVQVPGVLDAVPDALERLRALGFEASDNVMDEPATPPNDIHYPKQWALRNTGQTPTYTNVPGTPGADIEWETARTLSKGKDTNPAVVAILDSGIDFGDPDLKGRFWTNPAEFILGKGGVDDDGNGYVDDLMGYDFTNSSTKLKDTFGHGTANASIIGAIQDNGIGIAGVARNVRLMAVKVIGDSKAADAWHVAQGIEYATASKAHIISSGVTLWYLASDPTSNTSIAKAHAAIASARDHGVLVVVPAGNEGASVPAFPAAFDNIVRVAGTDNNDKLFNMPGTWSSNYGLNSVHLAAPGLATAPWPNLDYYPTFGGTSAAAPHVAGVAALLKSLRPDWTATALKAAILGSVEYVPGLAGKTITKKYDVAGGLAVLTGGGRLNALNAVALALNISFGPFDKK